MQGLSLPSSSMVTCCPLPPLQTRPTELPPPPQQPHSFDEPPDTVGQAWVRGTFTTAATTTSTTNIIVTAEPSTALPTFSIQTSPSSTSPSLMSTTVATTQHATSLPTSSVTVPLSSLPSVATTVSRTTAWRQRKRKAEAIASCSIKKPREQQQGYTCHICGKPMNKCKCLLYVMVCVLTNFFFFHSNRTHPV